MTKFHWVRPRLAKLRQRSALRLQSVAQRGLWRQAPHLNSSSWKHYPQHQAFCGSKWSYSTCTRHRSAHDASRELLEFLQERLIAKTGITNYFTRSMEAKIPPRLFGAWERRLVRHRLMLRFWASAKMDTSHSILHLPPISTRKSRTSPGVLPCMPTAAGGRGMVQNLDEVPKHAISMSVRQVLKAKDILAVVPDARKAAGDESARL